MIYQESCYNALKIIDGVGEMWSPSGQLLGQLSSIQDDPLSIINPDGIYGSQYSSISIRRQQASPVLCILGLSVQH